MQSLHAPIGGSQIAGGVEEMDSAAQQTGWELIGEPRYVQGYIHGFAHPSMTVEISMAGALSRAVADGIERQLMDRFPGFESIHGDGADADAPRYGAGRFIGWVQALRRLAYTPVDVPGRTYAVSATGAGVVIPCEMLAKQTQRALIKALVSVIDAAIRGRDESSLMSQLADQHGKLIENSAYVAGGLYFFRAAVEQGLPIRELAGGIVQFGIGSASRRMSGAMSDATSVIAVRLARDKRLAVQLLGQSGVPVPAHRTAQTAEQAAAFAQALGYPVVVKPADLDGGQGVAARLENADEVSAAFTRCRKLSANVIVEKFIEGRDYRIEVLNDEAIFAVERVPGRVVGNGVDTVTALIERLNAEPMRSVGPKPPLGKLLLDDEATAHMRKRGVDAQTVLPEGEVLQLRSAANIASGGTPVEVFAQAHPDNLALAVRAAQALRLDIAGVDLITPDITRSWRDAGGAICEVNAAPNMGLIQSTPAYHKILESTVPRGGRVPVVLIVGAEDSASLSREVSAVFTQRGLRVGCHTHEGISIDGAIVAKGSFISAAAGNLLALDLTVDAMVLCVNDTSVSATGLPVDRYDVLVLAGRKVSGEGGLNTLLPAVLPACAGSVIPVSAGGTVPAQAPSRDPRWRQPVSGGELQSALRAALSLQASRD